MKRFSVIHASFIFIFCLQGIPAFAQTADPALLRHERVAEIRCYRGFEPKRFLERIERYNEKGLLVELVTVGILDKDKVERNEYDSSGRIISKTITQSGSHTERFEYQYAADGSWKQLETDFITPWVCIKHTVSGKKQVTEIFKNNKVVKTLVTEGNIVIETCLDERGKWKWKTTWIEGQKHTREVRGKSVFKTVQYRDSTGRIIKEVETGPVCTGQVPHVDQRWGSVTYLKETWTTNTIHTYQYDAAGLLISKHMKYRSLCTAESTIDISYDYEYTRR